MRVCMRRLCVCLRLCRRWALIGDLDGGRAELPAPELSRKLADWLQGPRSRALRRAGIGRRDSVLEVGGGPGFVTQELARRTAGSVVAVDVDTGVLLPDERMESRAPRSSVAPRKQVLTPG